MPAEGNPPTPGNQNPGGMLTWLFQKIADEYGVALN